MDIINVIFVDVDLPNYVAWKNSINNKCKEINVISLHPIFAKNKSDCSYVEQFKSLIKLKNIIIFYHAGNCGEDMDIITSNVPRNYPIVLFTGSYLSYDIKTTFNDFKIKHFIDGSEVIHDKPCPWFFKDFFDDWVERGGPEQNVAPNFAILEHGSVKVAINTLHRLREAILIPLTTLHLFFQTDISPEEIERIFKDTKDDKLDIIAHISKSKSTLNTIQKNISINNISPADRLPGFSEVQDLLRIKKHINSDTTSNTLLDSLCKEFDNLETTYNAFNLNQNNKENREYLTKNIDDVATVVENLIINIEENDLA